MGTLDIQKELICVRCGNKGTIQKIKRHNVYDKGDTVEFYVCVSCKSYGSMWESLVSNAEQIAYLLDEDWEYADEKLLDEPEDEENTADLDTEEGIEKAKKWGIIKEVKE